MGELTSSIAHEVNQPLTAIVTSGSACLRWLSNDPPNVAEARELVSRIVKDGHRASDVVRRIRGFFKKTAPEKVSLEINHLIKDVIAMVPGELSRHRVQVKTELAVDLPPVIGDPIQLQQVLLNLVINSIEAMSKVDGARELLIKSQRYESDSVLVAVQDTGTVLTSRYPINSSRPFTPRSQMALAWDSRSVGPLSKHTAVDCGPQRTMGTGRLSGSPCRKIMEAEKQSESIVFVIDDDPSIRLAITGLIRSVGMRVESFPSAQEFMASKRPDAPACLVLDVRMPGVSGLDLQRDLRDADIRIPIIFITGHGDIPMSVRAMKAGAVGSQRNLSEIRICSTLLARPSSATVPTAANTPKWQSYGGALKY